jgi:hypothetical protein
MAPSLRSRKPRETAADAPRKRKASAKIETKPAKKTRKSEKGDIHQDKTQSKISVQSNGKLERPVIINRAPVLELWGACVAQFLNSKTPWATCLSIGSSIASLTAISKGRSIGIYKEKDKGNDQKDKEKSDNEDVDDLIPVNVMGFTMKLKDGMVIVKGKPRNVREGNLQRKFGERNFLAVKRAMTESLDSWAGHEEELNKSAFRMYEEFRPAVSSGQKGWGRKGELQISRIRDNVQRQQA